MEAGMMSFCRTGAQALCVSSHADGESAGQNAHRQAAAERLRTEHAAGSLRESERITTPSMAIGACRSARGATDERSPRTPADDVVASDWDRRTRAASAATKPHPETPVLTDLTPNVQGNRRAALTLAENQRMCRRVRLTVGLGPSVHDAEWMAEDRDTARHDSRCCD